MTVILWYSFNNGYILLFLYSLGYLYFKVIFAFYQFSNIMMFADNNLDTVRVETFYSAPLVKLYLQNNVRKGQLFSSKFQPFECNIRY